MGSRVTNTRIRELFDRFDTDAKFYWYSIEIEKYIGRLDRIESNQRITYARSKDDICTSLSIYHVNFVGDIIIYPESKTVGMPNAVSPIFIGAEWVGVWHAME